ncbi:hypothetical protein FAI40_01500 [Acetobacteraceae bacterium]|nr:hypothetical protein FAI40_01500 [Acetobacteraceae bacterium]
MNLPKNKLIFLHYLFLGTALSFLPAAGPSTNNLPFQKIPSEPNISAENLNSAQKQETASDPIKNNSQPVSADIDEIPEENSQQKMPKNFGKQFPNLPLPDSQQQASDDFTPAPTEQSAEKPKEPIVGPTMSPELRRMLNISALKSELMLIALTCNQHKEYNSFVTKFQNILQENYQSLKNSFTKLYAARGEMRLDQYMTDLADAASLKAAREGGNFCKTHNNMFHEAEYFQSAEDLSAYAEGKNLAVPLPKSPTGKRDTSPVTAGETAPFVSFAQPNPSTGTTKAQFHQQEKTNKFVPIKKKPIRPPLDEPKEKPKTTPTPEPETQENPADITFPASPASKKMEAPQEPVLPPQPYPDVSQNH